MIKRGLRHVRHVTGNGESEGGAYNVLMENLKGGEHLE
jgi:hypothetical protein